MKILLGTDLYYQNMAGSVNFIRQLTNGLVKDGHTVYLIVPARKFKDTVTKEDGMTVYGIRSVVIPEIIYPSNFRIPVTAGSTTIRGIINQTKPDVIHIQDHFMIGSKMAKEGKRFGIPLIGTNHFMPENFIHYLYPPDFAKKLIKDLAWKVFIRVYRQLDVITVPTKTAADLIKGLILDKPIIPISNGVDLNRFNPQNSNRYLKKRYHINSYEPVILFVGRLDKEKCVDTLLTAFAQVLPNLHAKLVITGKGTEKLYLINLAKRLGIEKNVIFTGFVAESDLPALYCLADVFVIASIAELQSIATMEAMASGLPVVAVKAIALPELIRHGQNGYLVQEGNIKALANQIVKILKNPALKKRMSQKGLKLINRHNIKNTIRKYQQIYKALAASKQL